MLVNQKTESKLLKWQTSSQTCMHLLPIDEKGTGTLQFSLQLFMMVQENNFTRTVLQVQMYRAKNSLQGSHCTQEQLHPSDRSPNYKRTFIYKLYSFCPHFESGCTINTKNVHSIKMS